ncbi:chaperone [Salpingoeca rosetta]|uniref:Chaperone n=1 Tax=Salpingoeca rosetta (strain ATCC 50818 / BSB-021) TaxID=946362 RepID=F2UIT1_SALR5|nr:chaperone [Salpingoeca rosetta]EGD77130.1 chaperone [Salpingoeca rosetta]|eukprot:XP_004990969.1 chaperone [Salpingoeca rosetta]
MSEGHIDYYELLGVCRTATGDEIRRAYRKLALRWHPDKNPGREEEATANFKRISEAYDVLSDETKRSIYDRYGYEGLKEGGTRPNAGFHFRDTSDIFREVFGFDPFGGSPFDGRGGRSRGNGHAQQAPFGGLFGSFFGDDMFGGFGNGFGDGFGGGFGDFGAPFGGGMGGNGFTQSSFTSSSFGGPGGTSFSQSSQTVIQDGKRITTTRTTQNGVTSERVEEVDQRTGEVLALTIDGQAQPVGRLEAAPPPRH